MKGYVSTLACTGRIDDMCFVSLKMSLPGLRHIWLFSGVLLLYSLWRLVLLSPVLGRDSSAMYNQPLPYGSKHKIEAFYCTPACQTRSSFVANGNSWLQTYFRVRCSAKQWLWKQEHQKWKLQVSRPIHKENSGLDIIPAPGIDLPASKKCSEVDTIKRKLSLVKSTFNRSPLSTVGQPRTLRKKSYNGSMNFLHNSPHTTCVKGILFLAEVQLKQMWLENPAVLNKGASPSSAGKKRNLLGQIVRQLKVTRF